MSGTIQANVVAAVEGKCVEDEREEQQSEQAPCEEVS